MTADRLDPATPDSPPDAGETQRPRIVTSAELLEGKRELWIEHAGEMYRLRITSRGKLYLTK